MCTHRGSYQPKNGLIGDPTSQIVNPLEILPAKLSLLETLLAKLWMHWRSLETVDPLEIAPEKLWTH